MPDGKMIEIVGRTYEANVIDLTDEELDSLVSALENGDPWEGNSELEERIYEDSLINGYVVEGGYPHIEINVIGDPIAIDKICVDLDFADKPRNAFECHHLVLEKWCRNSIETFELMGDFDRSKLVLSTEDYLLPTGTRRLVATANYGGEIFEFQQSWTEAISIYIIKKDGEVIQVE